MSEQVSFNINAELYENQDGELAIRFAGDKVYAGVGEEAGAEFVSDAKSFLEDDRQPSVWKEKPAHELDYQEGWRCISRMGYVSGDTEKPGIEMEVKPQELGERARNYLGPAIG